MQNQFRKELEVLVNKFSLENNSNTPDFILAEYLEQSLKAFDLAVTKRSLWYNEKTLKQQEELNENITNLG